MIRILLAVAGLLLLAPAAEAASFDCAKAATAFETAICDAPDLSKADETLAVAYATALGGLSPAAAATLKAEQHDWLDYAQRVCTDDATPLEGAYNDDQKQCLTSTFKSRIKGLEASRMQGGHRFYPFSRFLVEKDTQAEPDAFNKVADKSFTTVKIDGGDAFATAFNDMTEQLRVGYGDLFAKGSDRIAEGDVTDDQTIATTVSAVTDYRITLSTIQDWYGHGAAHPNYAIGYTHFLVSEQRLLIASDIFAAKGWEEKLGKLVLHQLQADLEQGVWDDAVPQIPGWAADPGRWDFSPQGLVVQFQPYEVASYAAGAVIVTVPWFSLFDLMSQNGIAIATY